MLRSPFASCLLFWAASGAAVVAADTRIVDHRYSPDSWHSPLGIPDDWHKPLTDERGALLYDFGPGPYAHPLTTIEFVLADRPLKSVRQWIENPRVPLVRTTLRGGEIEVKVTTLSVPPAASADSHSRFARYERLDGISGALGWAQPSVPCSPEFSNVAWGTNRPIRYRVRVDAGSRRRVALGFCESYKPRLGERIALLQVEGAPEQTVDLALTAARNTPQVFLFEAGDTDRDGWITITVSSPPGHDPNTTLASIAVYALNAKLTREVLIAGAATTPDPAELRIACGTESLHQPARTDAIEAIFPPGSQAVLEVRTGRALRADASGGLAMGEQPFVRTIPRALRVERLADRWRLYFPAGTTRAMALVFSGQLSVSEADDAVAHFDFSAAAKAVTLQWEKASVPFGRITVGDTAVQGLVDASLRVLYQGRERINGVGQFNSSFTLYRGLWAGDAVYFIELAALLGDFAGARETLDTLFSYQNDRGLIDEMPPLVIFRATPAVIWALERYGQLAGDWTAVERHWPAVMRAIGALRDARDLTLRDPQAANAGLLPAGFNDGGIAEITSEYSSVYWSLTGLRAAARAARHLGRSADAATAEKLATEFLGAFQTAAQRDRRTDSKGNSYLPVRVGLTGPDEIPQVAQWAVLEHHLFGDSLPLEGELLKGTLAMLEASERQGLPASIGWMRDGIWAGFGSLYAHLPLLLGRQEKAADLLYAVANHASPTGGWVEEQALRGAPPKTAGDQPHCWAASLFVRHALSMLACDRGGTTHLLLSTPPEWLRAGMINRLDRVHTPSGPLSLTLTVAADGATARLEIDAPREGVIRLHTRSLQAAGFHLVADKSPTSEPLNVRNGIRTTLQFSR